MAEPLNPSRAEPSRDPTRAPSAPAAPGRGPTASSGLGGGAASGLGGGSATSGLGGASLAGLADALRADVGPLPGATPGSRTSAPPRGLPPVPRAAAGRSALDVATVAGIGGALVLVAIALALGGSLGAYFDLASVIIVLGGTALVTAASFSRPDLNAAAAAIAQAVRRTHPAPKAGAVQVLETAEFARAYGLLKMQGAALRAAEGAPVLHKGLSLAIDAVPEGDIIAMLRNEIAAAQARLAAAAAVLRRAAEIAPAMGLIGTLVGLVRMLGNLDNPAAIGPAMAVALLTTFYGAIIANVVLVPLASKIERNAEEEAILGEVYLLGTLSVARKDNPRRLEMQLNSVLPPTERVEYFD